MHKIHSLIFISFCFIIFSCNLEENLILKKNSVLNITNGKLKYVDGTTPKLKDIDRDYYFIFYGADWCPYCKDIKIDVQNFYNTYKEKCDNFEFIFAGCKKDTSNEDLITYLKNEEYPFCYIEFEYREECGFFNIPAFAECEYFYIPGMILMDKKGNVLSNSNGKLKEDYVATRPFIYYTENLIR